MFSLKVDLLKQLEELKMKAERVFSGGVDEACKSPRGGGVSLFDIVAGADESSRMGRFFRSTVRADEVWEEAPLFYRDYLESLAEPSTELKGSIKDLAVLQSVKREKVCYLDIETTGLSASPLFLIGLMYEKAGTLYLDQLFARDYSEEPAVLDFFSNLSRGFDVVVTFNGSRFDLPFILDRMTYHKIEFEFQPYHIDLLPISRELVGGRTPDHRLQTLEMHLCGRKRVGDIPGHEIPDAYHEFVRSGEATAISTIFHHNRLDLVTMLQLVTIYLSRDRRIDECRD